MRYINLKITAETLKRVQHIPDEFPFAIRAISPRFKTLKFEFGLLEDPKKLLNNLAVFKADEAKKSEKQSEALDYLIHFSSHTVEQLSDVVVGMFDYVDQLKMIGKHYKAGVPVSNVRFLGKPDSKSRYRGFDLVEGFARKEDLLALVKKKWIIRFMVLSPSKFKEIQYQEKPGKLLKEVHALGKKSDVKKTDVLNFYSRHEYKHLEESLPSIGTFNEVYLRESHIP